MPFEGVKLVPFSLQARAVIIMWDASREWMKLGGKAFFCLDLWTSLSGLGPNSMLICCMAVQISFFTCRRPPECRGPP